MKRFFKPFSFFLIAALFLTTGQGCFGGGGGGGVALEQVDLEIWGVFDDKSPYDTIIDEYRLLHPNVKITYRKLRFDEYEDELIRAFAEDRGPDLFALHNSWMEGYKGLIQPMPASITVTEQEVRGSVRREVVVVEKEKTTMSNRALRETYVEQVERDVIRDYQPDPDLDPEERIFGLPLALDTLSLFYNRDLLDSAGFPSPPETWSDFQTMVPELTTYDLNGEPIQSGAAMGTSDNVERSTDILSLLMMQTGTEMTDERGRVAFHTVPADAPSGFIPALNALEFYTDYANPTKEVYSWNTSMTNSFDAFANGQAAFFLGYSYHVPLLRTAAPRLNFSISHVPQIDGTREVNYANYWVHVVSDSSEFSDWAWDFLLFASDEENVVSYLEEARKPTAHRSLIPSQLDDEELGIFVDQVLTAESWYQGSDANAAEDAIRDLIDIYLTGPEDPEEELEQTAIRVQNTYD